MIMVSGTRGHEFEPRIAYHTFHLGAPATSNFFVSVLRWKLMALTPLPHGSFPINDHGNFAHSLHER
jgi:hypothetical protein